METILSDAARAAFERSRAISKEDFPALGIAVKAVDDKIYSAGRFLPSSTLSCPAAASVLELAGRQHITSVTVCTDQELNDIPLIEWALLKAYGRENLTVTIVDPDDPEKSSVYSVHDLYSYPIARSSPPEPDWVKIVKTMSNTRPLSRSSALNLAKEIIHQWIPGQKQDRISVDKGEVNTGVLKINDGELTILHHPLLDPPDAAEPSTVRRGLALWMQDKDNCDGIEKLGGLPLDKISGADFQACKRMLPPDATIAGKTVAELTEHLYTSDHGSNHKRPVSSAWKHILPNEQVPWVEEAEKLLRNVMATIPDEKKPNLRLAVVTDDKEYVIVSNDPASLPWGYWTCAERGALELWASLHPDTVIEPLVLVHSVHDANGEGMIGPQACPCGSCAEAIGHRPLTVVGTNLKGKRQIFSNHTGHTLVPENRPSRPLVRQSITIHLADGTNHTLHGLRTEHTDCSHPPPLAWGVRWQDKVLVSSRLAPWLKITVSPIQKITLDTGPLPILTLEASRRQNPKEPPIPIQTITETLLEPPTQWALAMIQQRPNHR
jgi:hypothetical protein